jgi:hypothetical protein
MLRNFAYGGIGLVGGAITGIAIASWATPVSPPQVYPETAGVASVSQPSLTLTSASPPAGSDASDCSPWEVSDLAMEAMLNEMVRRGWRPPTQADALDEFTAYGSLARPVDPYAYMPVRRYGSSAPTSEEEYEDDEIEAFPVEQPLPGSTETPQSWEAPGTTPAPTPDAPIANEATLPSAN